MATCKDCFHYEACSGFKPTDLDKDVWCYCKMGIPEEIPDIDRRCDSFKDSNSWAEVVRCKDCKHYDKDALWCNKNSYAFGEEYHNWYSEDFCSYGERRTDG